MGKLPGQKKETSFRGRPDKDSNDCGSAVQVAGRFVGTPRLGLRPRPVSPFQEAFGRLRLPQSRPAGGEALSNELQSSCTNVPP